MIHSIQNTAFTFLENKHDTFNAKYSIAHSRTKSYNYKFELIKKCFVPAGKRGSSFLEPAAQEKQLSSKHTHVVF